MILFKPTSKEVFETQPTGQLSCTPWFEDVKPLLKILSQEGFEARIVGGCIRNSILKKNIHDVDIATQSPPHKTCEFLEKHSLKFFQKNIQYGTVTVQWNNRLYEITTLRKDISFYGARNASVQWTDQWILDAKRRDFTINAFYADIDGAIYDYVGSFHDLIQKKLCFIGPPLERIKEDPLRILRFFRLQSSLDFVKYDPSSLNACKIHHELILKLSQERIQSEILQILAVPAPFSVLMLMHNIQLLPKLIPKESNIEELRILIWLEIKALKHELLSINPIRRLCCLIINSDPSDFFSLWKLSKKDQKLITKTFDGYRTFAQHQTSPDILSLDLWRQFIYQFSHTIAINVLLLRWAHEKYLAPNTNNPRWILLLNELQQWESPIFPLSGYDLQTIGYTENARLGKILTNLTALWKEKNFSLSKEELLKIAQELP